MSCRGFYSSLRINSTNQREAPCETYMMSASFCPARFNYWATTECYNVSRQIQNWHFLCGCDDGLHDPQKGVAWALGVMLINLSIRRLPYSSPAV